MPQCLHVCITISSPLLPYRLSRTCPQRPALLRSHVGTAVDALLGILGYLRLEPLLDLLQDLLISITAHETDRQTLGTEATGTTHTMKIAVGVVW